MICLFPTLACTVREIIIDGGLPEVMFPFVRVNEETSQVTIRGKLSKLE